ncbi:MAG TPA: hypothetical protein VLH17_03940, partial [Candidatus Binatia bacterium]|nr:hypothetical protein [Candidatus Binatia bacterium]
HFQSDSRQFAIRAGKIRRVSSVLAPKFATKMYRHSGQAGVSQRDPDSRNSIHLDTGWSLS